MTGDAPAEDVPVDAAADGVVDAAVAVEVGSLAVVGAESVTAVEAAEIEMDHVRKTHTCPILAPVFHPKVATRLVWHDNRPVVDSNPVEAPSKFGKGRPSLDCERRLRLAPIIDQSTSFARRELIRRLQRDRQLEELDEICSHRRRETVGALSW